jgi:hypothetical protein
MTDPYVDAATQALWHTEYLPRLFATAKALGNTQMVTFSRDTPADTTISVGPYECLVKLASGGAAASGGGGTPSYIGVTGEFRVAHEVPIERGDRFCLAEGPCGVVTTAPIPEIAYKHVPFVIER